MSDFYRLNDNGSRSLAQAEKQILERTSWENLMRPIMQLEFEQRLKVPCKLENYGVDNSGRLIEGEEALKYTNKFADSDWRLTYGSETKLIEAMVHPERFSTCSFKISKLESAIERNFHILVLRDTYYLVFSPDACKHILQNYPTVRRDRIMGGKPIKCLSNDDVFLLNKRSIIKWIQYHPKVQSLVDQQKWVR